MYLQIYEIYKRKKKRKKAWGKKEEHFLGLNHFLSWNFFSSNGWNGNNNKKKEKASNKGTRSKRQESIKGGKKPGITVAEKTIFENKTNCE